MTLPTANTLPIPIPSETSSTAERRRSPMPPPHARQGGSLEGSPPKGYWEPPTFNPAEQRATLDNPVVSYRRYSEDVQQGVVTALPECPRTVASTGCYGWLTLPQTRNFDICPDCYDATFANTQFRHSFVPAPLRGADTPVTCDFGSSHWYRVAWLMTIKYGIPDLRLLKGIAAIGAKHQQCAGNREANRIWYSILDPYAKRPVPTFAVCPNCAKTIEVILPNLFGAFVELDAPAIPTRGVCDMHFTPGRKRFLKIFDLLESASDAALARQTPPNLQKLADQIRDVTITPECMRDEPVPGRKWHVMESIPEFTVCEECFEEVVLPIVEGEGGSVARNFFKRRQERPMATCQLYSDRMRDIFRKACRRDDLGYLDDRVKERLDIEASIKTKLAEHPAEEETRQLLEEWQKWE
ncbi:Ser/Arg-related nuclear matrix protein [Coniochaeta hoffmannii]|uniref:Ser/Arg-related nuclear matrix protein n=1 Tax=Coniochaeta hoffmannii TaxID=91930 RepID=A0AA38RGF6_9PEZI|nr:Ser/Arg-related nuclear matrix protein [Coniochaeta hoffmannii]